MTLDYTNNVSKENKETIYCLVPDAEVESYSTKDINAAYVSCLKARLPSIGKNEYFEILGFYKVFNGKCIMLNIVDKYRKGEK